MYRKCSVHDILYANLSINYSVFGINYNYTTLYTIKFTVIFFDFKF